MLAHGDRVLLNAPKITILPIDQVARSPHYNTVPEGKMQCRLEELLGRFGHVTPIIVD
jgi:hypothetical protein